MKLVLLVGLVLGSANGLVTVNPCCETMQHMPADFNPVHVEHLRGELVVPKKAVFLCNEEMDDDLDEFEDKIAFLPRGDCKFAEKVYNAQRKKAKAVIVYNYDQPMDRNALVKMSVESYYEKDLIAVPSFFISYGSYLKLQQHLDNNIAVEVIINATGEYNPDMYDPSPLFLSSILYMLELLLIVWSIVAVFYFINWIKMRYQRRKRLLVVRKLPTRVYRAPSAAAGQSSSSSTSSGERIGGNGDKSPIGSPSSTTGLIDEFAISDRHNSCGGDDDTEMESDDVASGCSRRRHPKHGDHHLVAVEEGDVELVRIQQEGQPNTSSSSSSSYEPVATESSRPITDYYSCDSCVICLCNFEDGEKLTVLPCGHGYHKDCIEPWLIHKSALCPICKQSILPSGDSRSLSEIASSENDGERDPHNSRGSTIMIGGIVAISVGSSLLYILEG